MTRFTLLWLTAVLGRKVACPVSLESAILVPHRAFRVTVSAGLPSLTTLVLIIVVTMLQLGLSVGMLETAIGVDGVARPYSPFSTPVYLCPATGWPRLSVLPLLTQFPEVVCSSLVLPAALVTLVSCSIPQGTSVLRPLSWLAEMNPTHPLVRQEGIVQSWWTWKKRQLLLVSLETSYPSSRLALLLFSRAESFLTCRFGMGMLRTPALMGWGQAPLPTAMPLTMGLL